MESREARDAMVARVRNTFRQFPTFQSLPEVSQYDLSAKVTLAADSYIQALHVVCANGEIIGRDGDRVAGRRAPLPGQTEVVARAGGNIGMRIGKRPK